MSTKTAERECSVCGLFYPAGRAELRENIREMVSAVKVPKIEGAIRGVIGPHAGYMYSGLTAAHAYTLLRGARYSSVVVVSPSHRDAFDGVSVFPGDSYSTPLGVVRLDKELREAVLQHTPVVKESYSGHGEEHAVEVHLPFLQYALGDFKFLPLVIGDQSRECCFGLGEAIGDVMRDRNVLLVASTDLSHYHPSRVAEKLDAIVINHIRKFDYESLMQDLEFQRTEACGGGPTVAVMLALSRLGVQKMSILHHCNSGDITGDHSQVVGYLSAVAYE